MEQDFVCAPPTVSDEVSGHTTESRNRTRRGLVPKLGVGKRVNAINCATAARTQFWIASKHASHNKKGTPQGVPFPNPVKQ
jgi:hypothetical protein